MGYTTANKSASFCTIGEEDQATFEAISAGVGFEDVRARMTMRLLQKMMLKEEAAVLFGNEHSLGHPGDADDFGVRYGRNARRCDLQRYRRR
jgi:hypothetical protein